MKKMRWIGPLVWAIMIRGHAMYAQHIVNPIPELIQQGDLVVNLETFATIPVGDGYHDARVNMVRPVPDGSGRLAVIDLNGFLHLLDQQGKRTSYINFNSQFANFISSPGLGTGSGAVAFHPEFSDNGIFYTTHSERSGSGAADFSGNEGGTALQWVVTRWAVDNPAANTFSGSKKEILRIGFPGSIHGMQDITFNPYAEPGNDDYGMLYICNGDGASSEKGLFANVGTTASALSAILRIDPEGNNSANGKYGIPADNPFIDEPGVVRELWAYGFRNPHRLSFESRDDDILLFAGDIGHHKIEEINLIEKGGNYGWDRREGTFVHDRDDPGRGVLPLTGEDPVSYIYPVAQYDHGEGRAIALGHTWTFDAAEPLFRKMFFGDIPIGRLFFLPVDSLVQGRQYEIKETFISIDGGPETTFPSYHNNGRVDLRFGRDEAGKLLMFTKINGRIYKVTGVRGMKPLAAFDLDISSGHAPLTIGFDGSSSMGSNLTYVWDFGDGNTLSGASQGTHIYEEPGTYELSLVVNDGDHQSEVHSQTIRVYQKPNAVIQSSTTSGEPPLLVMFDARTSEIDELGTASYEWDFGDGNTSNKAYETHTFEESSLYDVVLKVEDGLNGVATDTLQIYAGKVLAVGEADGLSIYPNPVDDYLTIETAHELSVEITSMSGQTLYTKKLQKGHHQVDLSFLEQGAYVMRIESAAGHRSEIILKP